MPEPHLPRGKDELLREVDLRLRLSDIRRMYDTKSRIAPKWWEGAILLLLFASALGLLASLVQYARASGLMLHYWLVFWFGLMIVTVVFSFEFLLVKIYALRRANEVTVRLIEDMRKRQDLLETRLAELASARRDDGNSDSPASGPNDPNDANPAPPSPSVD
jgi:hypothetical protein